MADMRVLGIESSCDDTAAAVVDADGVVLSNVIASQLADHLPYGGVVPELAARAHLRAILPVVRAAVAHSEGGLADIDAVAVTQGPGLAGALIVGLQFAKTLAWCLGKPLIAVNHLEAHLHAAYLKPAPREATGSSTATVPVPELRRPFVALLASGGHTALYAVDPNWRIELLGQTRDDAAGEAFDKAAKLLGLPYPGGPTVDRLAALGNPAGIDLPTPLHHHDNLEFSFSGLKSALARHLEQRGAGLDDSQRADLCAAFQQRVVEVLATKSIVACRRLKLRSLTICGGVAANRGLRQRLSELCKAEGIALHIPPPEYCTDNAAMVAYAGLLRWQRNGASDPATVLPYSRDPQRVRGRF